MKINFKSLAIIAAAATIGMTACSKEDNDITSEGNGEVTNVSITLTQTGTKAVADKQTETTVSFTDGYVVFVNSVGAVNKVTEIVAGTYPVSPSPTEQAAFESGSKVWLGDMLVSGGGQIKNVPGSAVMVYIIGNLPQGVAAPTMNDSVTTLEERVITIASQNNVDGNTENVTLFGGGVALTNHPTLEKTKVATVNVNAIASRIEIGGITYKNDQTNLITNFQIDGIFINYYYPTMKLSSEVAALGFTNNAPATNVLADAVYEAGSTAYPSNMSKLIYDYDSNGIGTGSAISYKPGTDKFWAYNVLAPLTCEAGLAITAPHVIIRISDIETINDGGGKLYDTTQYLTVKNFKDKNTGIEIPAFQPGYVYFITDLAFNESNLTEIPEMETVTAYVEAVLMTWTRQEVVWGF